MSFDSAARERHRVFDRLQAETFQAAQDARDAGLVTADVALGIETILGDQFVPNIKHGRAVMPKELRGQPGVAVIPLMRPGQIMDISGLVSDVPHDDAQNFSVTIGEDAATVREGLTSLFGAPRSTLSVRPAAAVTQQVAARFAAGGQVYTFTARSVVGFSSDITPPPSLMAHEIAHVKERQPYEVERPELSLQTVEKATRSERIAYNDQHTVNSITVPVDMPDYRQLAEEIQGMSWFFAEEHMNSRLNEWQARHGLSYPPRAPIMAKALSHVCGITDMAQPPNSAEVGAYRFFGFI